MEKKMETTIMGLGLRDNGKNGSYYSILLMPFGDYSWGFSMSYSLILIVGASHAFCQVHA